MPEKFYDVHCHAMNLSHPNLFAFARKINIPMLLLGNSFIAPIVSFFGGVYFKRVMNLLSLMENDLGSFFLQIEEKDIVNSEFYNSNTDKLIIGGKLYDKIVLTPLMMDFGNKEIDRSAYVWYDRLPEKPIVEQVRDLFNGINEYHRKSRYHLFEIYPFLGLNTKNYPFTDVIDPKGNILAHGLKYLLDKYFTAFTHDDTDRKTRLEASPSFTQFDGKITGLGNHSFAGIKVYPPLGFDPWPQAEHEKLEMEKVKYLYDYCCARNIPITAHCGSEGFLVISKGLAMKNTSPDKWLKVLSNYPTLKLNLAHFGGKLDPLINNSWAVKISNLIKNFPNVYTDISYICFRPESYKALSENMVALRNKKLKERLLFGSDFMINLINVDSYQQYLKRFSVTEYLSNEEKELMTSINPERFLFGERK